MLTALNRIYEKALDPIPITVPFWRETLKVEPEPRKECSMKLNISCMVMVSVVTSTPFSAIIKLLIMLQTVMVYRHQRNQMGQFWNQTCYLCSLRTETKSLFERATEGNDGMISYRAWGMQSGQVIFFPFSFLIADELPVPCHQFLIISFQLSFSFCFLSCHLPNI